VADLNYQQDLLDRKVTIGVGWAPVGDTFATLPILCDFQNVMICGHANAMSTNSRAENFPTGEWGTNITVRPVSEAYLATGIYQVNLHASDGGNGLDLSFRGTGVFVPFELGWLTGHSARRLEGTYKVGAYYNSSPTADVFTHVNGTSAGLTGEPFIIRSGRWGAYVIGDQRVTRPMLPGQWLTLTVG
jgi:porin